MRFELGDQFWEVLLDGTSVRIRHGKIGTEGTPQMRRKPTEQAAREEYEGLVAELELRGFRPPVPVEEAEPPGRAVPSNPELEHAIEDDPDDEARLLVYADWLQQQGDPRGELAAIQHALSTAPTDELHAREKALAERHPEHLLGPLAPLIDSARPAFAHQRWEVHGMDPKWRCGYLDSIRISAWNEMDDALATIDDRYERWPQLRAILPDEDDSLDIRGLLRIVLGHPASRFLRDLRFGMTTNDYGPLYDKPLDGGSLLDVLIEHAIPTLRRIEFGALDFTGGEMEYSWVGFGDLGKVLRHFDRLHEIVLAGSGRHGDAYYYDEKKITPNPMSLTFGALDLPELRRFALRTTDLHRDALADLTRAHWPKLERLELWFGSPDQGADCTVEDAERLLASLPTGVIELGLQNCAFADNLIEPLAASPALARAKVLDLSLGCLSDDGAAELVEYADAFAHLDELILDDCYLSSEGRAMVAKISSEVSTESQREADIDEDGPHRYVAVWE